MIGAGAIPAPIRESCEWLVRHGLQVEGIFRIPGRNARVRELMDGLDANPAMVLSADEDAHDVCALIVRWFAQIKDESGKSCGIWVNDGYDMKPGIRSLRKQKRVMDAAWVHEEMSNLSEVQVSVFREVSQLFVQANKPENVAHNKMNANKFAMCLLPAIMEVLEIMILHYDAVFQ